MSLITHQTDIPTHDRRWLQFLAIKSHEINREIYRRHPYTPAPIFWNIVYDGQINVNIWDTLFTMLRKKKADCKDISPAVSAYIAEVRGLDALPLIIPVGEPIEGVQQWHCLTTISGVAYDPCYFFGMKGI